MYFKNGVEYVISCIVRKLFFYPAYRSHTVLNMEKKLRIFDHLQFHQVQLFYIRAAASTCKTILKLLPTSLSTHYLD